jgi:hypothetical protein
MSSKTSINYAFYYLYPKQYVNPPDRLIKGCPKCAGALSKSSISPSKAVTSFLDSATMPYHNFSHLYECPTCHWWAVWESFGDAEYSPDYHFLIASLSDDDQVSLPKPWNQALENENVYDHDVPLPKSLEQVLVGGKKRILDLPTPGDKVRLVGDVHMLRDPEAVPFEFVPLFIGGSEGTVVDDEELYDLIKDQHVGLEPEYVRNLLIRLKANLDARNCCPIRLEKLVIPHTRQSSCKKGEIYLIDAADIVKMY